MFKSITICTLVLAMGTAVNANETASKRPDDSFNRVVNFIESSMIGKTLETSIKTTIQNGDMETEFHRQRRFAYLTRTSDVAIFDCLITVQQQIWDLDAEGNRISEVPDTKDRFILTRFEIRRSKSSQVVSGIQRVLSSSEGNPAGRSLSVVYSMDGDQALFETCTDSNLVDAFAKGGGYKPMVFRTETNYHKNSDRLASTSRELGFELDPMTEELTSSGHDVVLEESEPDTTRSANGLVAER